jgi:tRNA nucleotidyltransferase (CCA-adding enzyme)
LIEDADLLRRPERTDDFLLACEADYRGRKGLEDRPYPQAARLRTALEAALAVRASTVPMAGLEGKQIGEKIREARLEAISDALNPAN